MFSDDQDHTVNSDSPSSPPYCSPIGNATPPTPTDFSDQCTPVQTRFVFPPSQSPQYFSPTEKVNFYISSDDES